MPKDNNNDNKNEGKRVDPAEQRRLQLQEFLKRKEEQKKKQRIVNQRPIENKPPNLPPKQNQTLVVPTTPATPANTANSATSINTANTATTANTHSPLTIVDDPFFSKTPTAKRPTVPERYNIMVLIVDLRERFGVNGQFCNCPMVLWKQ